MKNIINTCHIEGYIYENKLTVKTAGETSKHPGTVYITGELNVATDEACTNIVSVHFTYVTATFGSTNKPNTTFNVLKDIAEGKVGTVMTCGKDSAGKVRIDSAIGVNDFYSDKSGTEELISAKRNEGGFVHLIDTFALEEQYRNTFQCDMIITKATRVEADPERQTPEKVILHGATFDYRKALLPVEFTVTHPGGMNYFESLEPSTKHPVFTNVQGHQISATVVKTITEESAFGDPAVREVKSTRKEWVVSRAKPETYLWDDESTITAKELSEALANRETYLATVKQRSDAYKASKNGAPAVSIADSTGFNF